MINPARCTLLKSLFLALALFALLARPLRAEDVFVTAYKGNTTTTDVTPSPYCTYPTGTPSASGSSSFSTATPSPAIVPRRSRFGTTSGTSWVVQPGDNAGFGFSSLQSPGVYKVYVTMPTSGSAPSDIVVNITASGGTLGDTNGVSQTTIPTSLFRTTSPAVNNWIFIAYLTNTTPNPSVTFTHASGGFSRFYMDAIRFENIGDPCFGSGATQVGVNGPLSAGQTFVNVTGVTAGSTNITVYADSNQIGSTNYAPGFAAGQVAVPTSALNQGSHITATQKRNGCTSAQPGSGILVGGGANPAVRAFITCWKNPTNAGPIGATSTGGVSGGFPYILSATGFQFGFNTAPLGGRELQPGQCWQLATFQNRGPDDAVDLNSGSHVTNTDSFCSLEGLVFSIDGDSGPYDIYVDQIKNGDTVVEDFESYSVGTTNTFVAPGIAGSPPASATYLTSPNSALVSANYAFDGTKSSRIQWQFTDAGNTRWAHVLANASTGKHYPQLDTTKPITIRYLLLPVGTSVAHLFNGTIGSITNSGPNYTTGTNTIGIAVTGAGSYTYLWTLNGGGLPNTSTAATYTIGDPSGVSSGDSGIYQVDISDGTCTESRTYAFSNIDPVASITNQPVAKTIAHVGDNVSFSVGGDGHFAAGYPLTYQWKFNGADITDATDATFSTNNVQVANAGSYTVGVSNSFGGTLSSAAILDVVQPGVVIGTGTGLRGNYYSSHFYTNGFTGAPTLSRIDPTVNFDFGTGSPDPLISTDFFMVRWVGQVQALDTDTYTFYSKSDDGQRLWVNGQPLVNDFLLHGATEHSGTIALTANQKYNLLMEYFENGVSASAQLSWSTAGGGVAKEIIPMSQLYPATTSTTNIQSAVAFALSNGTNLTLNFGPGSYILQSATVITGPYSNIGTNVISPLTLTNAIGPGQTFYRLKVQ